MKRKKPLIRVVPASQAKNNFGEVIRRVYEGDETQIIERAGMPVVAIVSMSDLERLYPDKLKQLPQKIAASAKRQRAARRLLALMDETAPAARKLDEAEVETDVLKAVQEVRHSPRRK